MRLPLILLTLALASCSAASDDASTDEAEDTGEYTIDEDTGEASMTINTPEGETSMRSGATVEPDLPEGWTIHPDAAIENVVNIGGVEGRGTIVTMLIPAEPEAIIAYYRAQGEATGHEIQMELTTNESLIVGGENAVGGTFSVSVVPAPDGDPALVQLTVGGNG